MSNKMDKCTVDYTIVQHEKVQIADGLQTEYRFLRQNKGNIRRKRKDKIIIKLQKSRQKTIDNFKKKVYSVWRKKLCKHGGSDKI